MLNRITQHLNQIWDAGLRGDTAFSQAVGRAAADIGSRILEHARERTNNLLLRCGRVRPISRDFAKGVGSEKAHLRVPTTEFASQRSNNSLIMWTEASKRADPHPPVWPEIGTRARNNIPNAC